ncbi:MAG: hypothetical protein Q8S35_00970, partial [bacterium]|nr:hypothetical protein [bacterium]
TVTVSSAQSPALSCTVSSTSVAPNESVTYSANPSGGASGPYTWTAADGGSYGTASTANRNFSTPGTYAMNVSGSNAGVSYCPNVTVTGSGCTGTPTPTVDAVPNRVRQNNTTTLTWSGTNVATSCVLTGPGVNQSVTANTCAVATTVTPTPAIATQSTYCVSCDGGTPVCKTVNVIPNFQEF